MVRNVTRRLGNAVSMRSKSMKEIQMVIILSKALFAYALLYMYIFLQKIKVNARTLAVTLVRNATNRRENAVRTGGYTCPLYIYVLNKKKTETKTFRLFLNAVK